MRWESESGGIFGALILKRLLGLAQGRKMDPKSIHGGLGPAQGWAPQEDGVSALREPGYFQNQTEDGNNNVE